ncbi:MAG: tetratricopeptide repeat protein [Myxococcota bacterium]
MSGETRAPRFVRMARSLILLACLASTACVTVPLEDREWVTLQSEHYDVLSSLRDDPRKFAIRLEAFRAAAEAVWGLRIPDAPVRTRVIVMDDRSVDRLFNRRSELAYLLPSPDGDTLVFRGGNGWGDIREAWRLIYARRLFWNASREPHPAWFEEGMAQVASTLNSWPGGASLGVLQRSHVRLLRNTPWLPLSRIITAEGAHALPARDRELFEAQAWATAHYLQFHEPEHGDWAQKLENFRALRGHGAGRAFRSTWGDPDELHRPILRYVADREMPFVDARIGRPERTTDPRPATRTEVLAALGELSLALDRPDDALDFFEQALEEAPDSPRARAGLAAARADLGDPESALDDFEKALEQSPSNHWIQKGFADLLLAESMRDRSTPDPALLDRARSLYIAVTQEEGRIPAAHLGLAASYLLPGEDAASGRPHAARARRLLPGDAEVARVVTELALADGDREAAERSLSSLHSRARSDEEVEMAEALRRAFEGPSNR